MNTLDSIHLNNFITNFKSYFDYDYKIPISSNLNIYSCDSYLNECYLQELLKFHFTNVNTVPKQISGIDIHCNNNFNIIDMYSLSSFQAFILYIKELVKNTHVLLNSKHIYILKNFNNISISNQQLFLNCLDHQKHTIFITLTSNLSRIIEPIKSRFMHIRLDTSQFKTNLWKYCEENCDLNNIKKKEVIKQIEQPTFKLSSFILNVHTPSYFDILSKELSSIINSIKKTKNIESYIIKVRETIFRLLAYNISSADISKHIFNTIFEKYKKNNDILHQLIHEISIMEHNIILSSKPIFHYEFFFIKLYKIINNI